METGSMSCKRLLPALACSLLALPAVQAEPGPARLSSGVDQTSIDRRVRIQDDLFRYANGRWLETTEIPPDRSSWGAFHVLAEQAVADVRTILESPAPAGDAEARAIRIFYASFMDEARVEGLGARPAAAELARIDGLDSIEALSRYVGSTSFNGGSAPLGVFASIDRGDSDTYAVYVWQNGLGLPDRDYYLRDDEKFVEIRRKYLAYLEKLFALAGIDAAAERAAGVLDLEHALAEAQWTKVANRDPKATYNVTSAAAATKLAPGFGWDQMLEGAGLPADTSFVLGQPGYATALGTLLAGRPLAQWKDYLKARLLNDYAPYLSGAFVEASFDFNGRTLSGTPENRPRWKRAVAAVNGGMGFAVGREYVARHFPPEAKARMDTLVGNLIAAMDSRIGTLEWMTPATREQAHEKLRKVRVKIGYPEVWQGYDGLQIRADDLLGNVVRAGAFEWRRQLERLNRPVDRTEWLMTPQTVNAYYMPPANEIVFPAAILQPPFFNFGAEDAVNYGAIGAVIGHEISHGFDDKGRQYDGDGKLRDWWVPADDEAFGQRTRKLVAQYSSFRPLPDTAVNGELTLGENIGDLSGLAIAWQAWQISLDGKQAPVIEGLTGPQRFFLGFAQIWRTRQREEALRRQVLSDRHSPAEYRANGVVANFEPFYATFDLKQGDRLWRPAEDRVTIW
jgi:endothelin-converting enzyme